MAENGSPLMHSLRLDLSTHIARRLAPFAKAYIQSFDLICANEGVIIFRRDQGTTSTDIIAIESLELIGAIPWDSCSNHQLLAIKDYASTHLVAES